MASCKKPICPAPSCRPWPPVRRPFPAPPLKTSSATRFCKLSKPPMGRPQKRRPFWESVFEKSSTNCITTTMLPSQGSPSPATSHPKDAPPQRLREKKNSQQQRSLHGSFSVLVARNVGIYIHRPGIDAADEIVDLAKALVAKNLCSRPAAEAMVSMKNQGCAPI